VARSRAWFAVIAFPGIGLVKGLFAVILIWLQGSRSVPDAGAGLFTVVMGLVVLAVQALFTVALPLLASVAAGSEVSRRQAGLVLRGLVVALAFIVVSIGVSLLLSTSTGVLGAVIPFVALDIVLGLVLGVVATAPWFGGFASRRFDALRSARASVLPDGVNYGRRPATWQGYAVVSIASAMLVGAAFALYAATIASPIAPGSVLSTSWLIAIGAGATFLVTSVMVVTAVAFAHLARLTKTAPVRTLIIVGGLTLSVSLVTVPLLVEVSWPLAAIAGFVVMVALIGLALAGGALAPWRYGFASTAVDSSSNQK